MPDDLKENLGAFRGRYAMCHTREYAHEIRRVWESVTTSSAFDVWFMPISKVEPRHGAPCSFTFGGPEREATHGTVSEISPGTLIHYQCKFFAHRFELTEVEGGTRCDFLQIYSPEFRHDVLDAEPSPEGWDLPAGVDVAWRPGMVAGYHASMENLKRFLDRSENPGMPPGNRFARWDELVPIYREHIRDHCPPRE